MRYLKTCLNNKIFYHYVAASYSVSNSISYVFNNVAFLNDLLESANDSSDEKVEIPAYIIVSLLATALLFANWRTYYRLAKECLNTGTAPLLPPVVHPPPTCQDRCEPITSVIGAIFKAMSMGFASFLLLKKLGGKIVLSSIISSLLFLGNVISQIALFKDTRVTQPSTEDGSKSCCQYNVCYHYIAGSYGISTSASYVFSILSLMDFLNSSNQAINVTIYCLTTLLAITLLFENWRTYFNLSQKLCGATPTKFPKNTLVTVMGAFFKATCMGAASYLLIENITGGPISSTILPIAFFPGNLVSQVGLFSSNERTSKFQRINQDYSSIQEPYSNDIRL